jgi:cytochrome c
MAVRVAFHRRGFPRRAALPAALVAFGLLFSAIAGLRAAPDIEFGRYLATQCLTCHRPGPPNPAAGAIPNIFGMAEPRFTALVKGYREKKLPNPVMQTAVGNLKDDEIEALAAYFARTTRP